MAPEEGPEKMTPMHRLEPAELDFGTTQQTLQPDQPVQNEYTHLDIQVRCLVGQRMVSSTPGVWVQEHMRGEEAPNA